MGIRAGWHPCRRLFAIIFVALLIAHITTFHDEYYDASRALLAPLAKDDYFSSCDYLPGIKDIYLVLRTGANEAAEKLPVHFKNTLRCLPKNTFGIYSDLEEDIDGYHVTNVLDELDPKVLDSHPDFEYYRRLQQDGRAAFTGAELNEWATAVNGPGGQGTPGWVLDKWKFLPMVARAYRERPYAKWYLFMESDTSITWRNMLQFLSQLNDTKPYYMGKEMFIGDTVLAYGGAAFVISNAAMEKFAAYTANKIGLFEELTGSSWAGDAVLGDAMKKAGVSFSFQRTNFFGTSPCEVDYSETLQSPNRRLWCYYTTTYHHMSTTDIDEISKFESNWDQTNSSALRHADVFHSVILPKFGEYVGNWDNCSMDDESSELTFEDCRAACQKSDDCLQFVFYQLEQVCKTSRTIKLGHIPEKGETNRHGAVSGWMMGRVQALVRDLDDACVRDPGGWLLPK